MDHRARLDVLRAGLDAAGVDGVVVTEPIHVRYLTGFVGSAGFVVVGPNSSSLVTDARYGDVGREVVSQLGFDVALIVANQAEQRSATTSLTGSWRRVGIEADSVTWNRAIEYQREWFPSAEVVATTGLVAGQRLVKEAGEIARIERAAAITDSALAEVRCELSQNPTEQQFRVLLDRAIIDAGADDLSFPTIVASGPNAARPHHVPSDRAIGAGDLVIVDVGALVDGYHSDMTRTFSIGEPAAGAKAMIDAVMSAHAAGCAALGPGVTGDDIDRSARDVIAAANFGQEFTHGVGHGLGLLIHEDPFLLGSSVPLRVGQVVTVEPGVYRSGVGGVRIEDTLLVTEQGCRPLTHSPKDPVVDPSAPA